MLNDTQPEKPKMNQRFTWIWWILVLVMLAWNVYAILPHTKPNVNLPYSAFQDQVKANNIDVVNIAGSTITGSFISPVLWPPTSAAVPTPGATPTPNDQTLYSQFNTTFPEVVGDTNLVSLLNAHNVQINVAPAPSPLLSFILSNGLPLIFLVGLLFFMGRQISRSQSGMFNFGRSKPKESTVERPSVTFNDVAGEDSAKKELKEVVDFLRHPKKYHDVGARVPRGVLLVGPPGTGKTLLARAVAGEASVPFFSISASEFVEMFVGVGASRVRDLFTRAKTTAPAIVFIDELDAVGRRRGAGLGAINDEREQTLNQLLVELDGFDEHHEVIVLAATNRPDVLDPAILRPGRFDRQVTVGLPDRPGRQGILHIHTRKLILAEDVDLNTLAQSTTGFSGADLANLCNEAALVAASNNHTRVAMADFEKALDRIVLGETRSLLLNEKDRKTVAYHESGHALVAWLSPAADMVHKVTIIPHGRALGVTEQLPGEDQYNYSRGYILTRLMVMLGGRAAEEIALDDITTGAENDLMEATRLARRMITHWGMGSLGLMTIPSDEQQPFLGYELTQNRDYSEETAAHIDKDVQAMLQERYEMVKRLVSANRAKLDQLVEALLKDETIGQAEITRILGPRDMPALAPEPAPAADGAGIRHPV
jgi:cell division protease FtsH